MTSIDDLICQLSNPFDDESLTPANFWRDQQNSEFTVNSIHQEAVTNIENYLNQVAKYQYSKTLLLLGDAGLGKSYLLGRLKRTLNDKAFFVYIDPWADDSFKWRHILRQTVDSLVQTPEGKTESQLLLWLKGLSAFKAQGIAKLLLGEKGLFILNLRSTYPSGVYNAREFFGVLYDLTNPELYPLACDWLRGDDLCDDDLKLLKVKSSIDNEEVAKNILANFSRISTHNQPIILCFDQLDDLPKMSDGYIDIQSLMTVNTNIHTQNLNNFLIVISMRTNTYQELFKRKQKVDTSDLARIHGEIKLKSINLPQVEQLWTMRLNPLHQQATHHPVSQIYPLSREQIKINFPGGKTDPRSAIIAGRKLYQQYKEGLSPIVEPTPSLLVEDFKLLWHNEYNKTIEKISKNSLIAEPQLITMLQEVLASFQIPEIKPKLLPGKYNIYSCSYQKSSPKQTSGIVWIEGTNMTTFYHVMKACEKVSKGKLCDNLYLLRANSLGDANLTGNKLYRQIFTGNSQRKHIRPNLTSIHYLVTYHKLVSAARAEELVIAEQVISLTQLESLACDAQIFEDCSLLQQLDIIATKTPVDISNKTREYLLNVITKQKFMSKQALINYACQAFSDITIDKINTLIIELCQKQQISIVNPQEELEKQMVCLHPQSKS